MKKHLLVYVLLLLAIQLNTMGQYYIKVERTIDMGGCWMESRNWLNTIKTVVQPLKKNDNASCYSDGTDNCRNTQAYPLLYHNKACPEVLQWNKFIFDWVANLNTGMKDILEGYSEVESIDDQIDKIGVRNQGGGYSVDIESFNYMDSYNPYTYWYNWYIESLDPTREVLEPEYTYNSYSGSGVEYYTCDQGYPSVKFKITVDNPIFLTLKSKPTSTSSNLILEYSAFYDNNLGAPIFQLSDDGVNNWKDIPDVSFNSSGGTISLNYANYNFNGTVHFRVRKTLDDGKDTPGYGNTLAVDFSTLPQINTFTPTVLCEDSKLSISGSYTDVESSQFKCLLEARLATGTDDDWAPISNSSFAITTTSSQLGFSDITNKRNWLGKEILIRPYYYDYFGNKIEQTSFKSVAFLPYPNMTFSPTNPTCFGGDNGSFTLTFNDLPAEGTAIPLLITLKKYDLHPIAAVSDDYQQIYIHGVPYYYTNGLTISQSVTGKSITINNTLLNSPYVKLSAGVYEITAQFNNGGSLCPVTQTFFLTDPAQFTASASDVKLNSTSYSVKTGETSGSIAFSFSGGTAPYYYKDLSTNTPFVVNSGAVTITQSVGSHKYGLYDSNGCSVSDATVTLSAPSDISINNSTSGDVRCNTNNSGEHGNGSVSWKIDNGYPAYTANLYRSSNPDNAIESSSNITKAGTVTFNDEKITKGTYFIKVSDALNTTYNKISEEITIGEPKQLIASLDFGTISCNGGTSSITITGKEGSGSYQYSLDGSNYISNNVFADKFAGNYTGYVKDANNCIANSDSKPLTQPDALSSYINFGTISCNGGTTDVSITGKGGTGGYQYSLDGSSYISSNIFSNRIADNYIGYIKDANNCTAKSDPKSLTQPPALSASINFSTITCYGGTADVTITGNGGSGSYQYSLDGINYVNNNIFSGKYAGTYTGYVKDANNCTANSGQQLLDQPSALNASISFGTILCREGTTDVTVNGSGGTGSYHYSLDGLSYVNETVFSGKPSGTYIGYVKDDNNCKANTSSHFLDQPATKVSATLTGNASIICKGGSNMLTVGGYCGTGNLLCYLAPSPNIPSAGEINLPLGPFSEPAGTYTAYVKDANGCVAASSSVQLTEPNSSINVLFSNYQNSTCGHPNGKVTISINGGEPFSDGYDIELSGPTPTSKARNLSVLTYSGLLPGDYTLTITDQRGCIQNKLFKIENNGFSATAAYAYNAPGFNMHSCDESGSLQLVFTNGASPYSIFRTDNNTQIMTITDTSLPIVSGFPQGNYKLQITDNNNCVATFPVNGDAITFSKPSLKLNGVTSSAASCHTLNEGIHNNGNIGYDLNSSIGYRNYSVTLNKDGATVASPVSNMFSGLSQGNYSVVVSEPGCKDKTTPVTVPEPSQLYTSLSIDDSIACKGTTTSLTITASGGVSPYSYSTDKSYINNSGNIYPRSANTYIGYVKDNLGCIASSLPLKITESDSTFTAQVSTEKTSCDGAANGAVTFKLSGGTRRFHILLKNASGETLKNDYSNEYTNRVENLAPGDYTAEITDLRKCYQTVAFTIVPKTFSITKVVPLQTLCNTKNTGQISLTVENGVSDYNFALSKFNGTDYSEQAAQKTGVPVAGITFSDLYKGKYKITATDKQGCTTHLSEIEITTQKPDIILNASVGQYALCSRSATGELSVSRTNGDGTMDGIFDYAVLLNGSLLKHVSVGNTAFNLSNLANGLYHIEVTDNIGCQGSVSITLDTLAVPLTLASPVSDPAACATSPTGKITVPELSGTQGATDIVYHLNTGAQSTSRVFSGLIPASNYTVYATYGGTCTTKKTDEIKVNISDKSPVSFTLSPTNQSCTEIKNGKITISASSKYGTETFPINKIKITSDAYKDSVISSDQALFSNLKEQNYMITVFDLYHCSSSGSELISNLHNNPKPISITYDSAACNRANNGAIHLNITQPLDKSPYNYYLYSSKTIFSEGYIHELRSGCDTLRVTDSEGCPSVVPFEVPNTLLPVKLITPLMIKSASCETAINGAVSLSAINGIPGYKFVIPGRDTLITNNIVFKDFPAHYSSWAKVYDRYYCRDSVKFTVPVLPIEEQLRLEAKGVINSSCPGSASGKALFERKNGIEGFRYEITGDDPVRDDIIYKNNSLPIFDGYAKGRYLVAVSDTVHCKAVSEFTITEPGNVYISNADSVRVKEYGKPQGSLSATVIGGNHKYLYQWIKTESTGDIVLQTGTTALQSPSVTLNIGDLYTGKYKLMVQDTAKCNNGAWIEQDFFIAQPEKALGLKITPKAVSCNGFADGELHLAGTGGWKNYQYSFNGSYWRAVADSAGLKAGSYTVYVKDAEGAIYAEMINLSQPDPLTGNVTSIEDAQCYGYADGSVKLALSGGNYPYYLALSSVSSSWVKGNIMTGLTKGSYTIYIKDSEGCAITINADITEPSQITLSDTVITKSRCLKNNGSIMATVKGGMPGSTGYNFRYFNDTIPSISTTNEASNLYSGIYKLQVTDSRSCYNTFTLPISDITDLTIDSISSIPSLCSFDTTGRAAIAISKGNPPYTVTWSDNSHNTRVAGLKTGSHTVAVMDVIGCKVTSTFTIGNLHNLPHPQVAAFDSAACAIAPDGAAHIKVIENINKSPFDFYLIDSGDTSKLGNTTGDFAYKELKGKIYIFRIVDSKNCFTDTTLEIPVTKLPVSLSAPVVSPASCSTASNGKVTLTAQNGKASLKGYRFILPAMKDTIDGSSAQFKHLPASLNTQVYVLDKYNCSAKSQPFLISALPSSQQITLSTESVTNASCPGYSNGSAKLRPINGIAQFRYIVQGQNMSQRKDTMFSSASLMVISGYPQGLYNVTVLDSANCSADNSFIIADPEPVVISSTVTRVKAKGKSQGHISSLISGGNNKYEYQWLKIKDSGSDILQWGTTTLAPSATLLIKGLPAGNYRLLVKDTAQCRFENSDWIARNYTVTEPADTLGLSVSVLPVSCLHRSDGQISYEGIGGWGNYQYSIDSLAWNSNKQWKARSIGSYTIYVRDQDSVVFGQKVQVPQTDSLIISTVKTTEALCNGSQDGSISLSAKGGTAPYVAALLPDTANWPKLAVINGLPKSSAMADSIYSVIVKDSRNCKVQIETKVLQPSPIAIADTTITASRCLRNNGSIQVSVTGGFPGVTGYSFLWFNNDTSFKSKDAASLWNKIYHLKVTDSHLCSNLFAFSVPDISDLIIDTIISKPVICFGENTGSASLSISKGNPPYTIIWPDKSGSTGVTGLKSANNYVVNISDRLGCQTSKSFSVGSPTPVSIESHTFAQPLCPGVADGSLKVTATGGTPGYSYVWSTGKKGNSASGLDQGTYRVTITDAHNCINTFDYPLPYQHIIKPSLGPDISICQGNSYKLTPSSYRNYLWASDVGLTSSDSAIYASKAGHYYVKVTDDDGCLGYDTVAIKVSQTELQGKFLVATNVQQNDTVMIFETSWPLPDSVQFSLSGCKIIDSGKYYREVIYPETGTYSISLTAFLNDCLDKVTKEIKVVAATTTVTSKSAVSKLIQQYSLSPNPNNGQFHTEIHLRENADVTLRLANVGTGIINDIRTYKGAGLYTIDYDMSRLVSGTYVLYLQAGNEIATKTFIIQK